MGGLEALKIIKEKYRILNERKYSNELLIKTSEDVKEPSLTERKTKVIRPFICYLSQFDYGTMMQLITDEEKPDFYLEKPLPAKELVSLLRLLNIF